MAGDSQKKRAFTSYVHEDSDQVDKLAGILQAARIPLWRDKNDLGPGDLWKTKIREAIRSGSLAFLACFSTQSLQKEKSYQNEELTLAVEEFRLRAPGRTWLIPIRFDDCEIPDWDLGAGRTLRDLNYVDLFGDAYAENAVKLVEAIKNAMGMSGVTDPVIVRASVHEADAEERAGLLRRLTKEMVREPSREIELDELVTQEVSRVLAGMRDTERFPQTFTGTRSEPDRVVELAETAIKYWELIQPFCWSLQVAARWGSPETLTPWIKGLRAIAAEAKKPVGGNTVLLDLRDIPILVSVVVAALASTGQGRWDNFKALLVDNVVPNPSYQNKRVAMLEVVGPWDPFGYGEITAHVLARSAKTGDDLATAVSLFNTRGGYGKFHTPTAEWLFVLLRPVFSEQFPDDTEYENAFDYAEASIGVVNEDLGNMRDDGESGRPLYFRNRWFGRSTWRYAARYCDPVSDLSEENAVRGSTWEPLRAGLFGGLTDRAKVAIEQYYETFKEIASKQW